VELVEAPAFTRYLASYLDDEGYRALQSALVRSPDSGDPIEGTGGFRKLRWPDPRRNKGKRGGLRVIYYWFEDDQQLWLMILYGKDEKEDLNAMEKKALRAAIENELAQRRLARSKRRRK
jgi:hypothetical protein